MFLEVLLKDLTGRRDIVDIRGLQLRAEMTKCSHYDCEFVMGT